MDLTDINQLFNYREWANNLSLSILCGAVAFLSALLFVLPSARAQNSSINFPPGSSPVTIKGHVNPLSNAEHKLSVSAGQRVAIHLTSTSSKNLVRFNIRRDRFAGKPLSGANNVTAWIGTFKETGDYWIAIFALPAAGEENYTLVISTPPNTESGEGAASAPLESRLEAERVPVSGATPQDFVPPGWKIAAREVGDLNADGHPDQILQLVPADTPENRLSSDAAPETQALLILLSDSGKWRRAGLARKLLVADASQYSVDLKIRNNGVLAVEQDYGMSDVTNLKHLFRYNPQTGRFLLIGRDVFTYTRPLSADTIKISENYLTGVRLTTTGHFRGGIVASETQKREQIEPQSRYFEDINENAY